MSKNEELDHSNCNVVLIIQRAILTFGLCAEAKRVPFLLAQIAYAFFAVLLLTQTIALFMAIGHTEKLFECFSVLSFCSMGALKAKSIHTNYRKWFYILGQLQTLEFEQLNNETSNLEYESDGEDTNKCIVTHINKYTGKFRSISVRLYRLYTFTLIIFVLTPFIECLYWKLKSEEPVSYPHILNGWSPLDAVGTWGYLVTVSAELIAACYTVVVHVVFDQMVFGLMIFLSGQFLLLRDLTEGIAGRGRGYDLTPQRDARARYRIARCHRTLMTLENSIFELENLLLNILGIYFLVAIFTLCSVALRLSSEEMSLMKVVSLLQYTGGYLIQLFLFCYYGDMILHKSSVGTGEGVYASAWWRLTPRVRREALLLAAAQARVRRLRAGPFNRLDLPSFVQIVRAAYSYYAFLRK